MVTISVGMPLMDAMLKYGEESKILFLWYGLIFSAWALCSSLALAWILFT
jgi:hypothetical protein